MWTQYFWVFLFFKLLRVGHGMHMSHSACEGWRTMGRGEAFSVSTIIGPRDWVQVIRVGDMLLFSRKKLIITSSPALGGVLASSVVQAGFELTCVADDVDLILLPLPPKCWDFSCAPTMPHLSTTRNRTQGSLPFKQALYQATLPAPVFLLSKDIEA